MPARLADALGTIRLPAQDRNLILTGYTGPNQPAIAGRVAERLKMPFVNVYAQIEQRTGYSISDLRAQFGDTRLKTLEADTVDELMLRRAAVLQINGRTLLNPETLERLQTTGPVICLVARLDAVLRRLHLAMGARYHNPLERAAAVGQVRAEWSVRGKPGVLEVDTTLLTPEETVEALIAVWRQVQAA